MATEMWQGIQGHDAVVEQFRRSLAAARMASVYLFVGPEGVGKRAFALALAKTLLCERSNAVEMAPCGACASCVMNAAGSHPDLYVVERRPGVKFLQIDQFVGERDKRHREGFCHDIALRPKIGKRRVGIIDDADWFNAESANCLLKLLEEPPASAVLILIGTSRSRQLPTILSRVQVVRFAGLPIDGLAELLIAQGIAGDAAAAHAVAERSGGSLARARELAEPALWSIRDKFAAAWRQPEFDPAPLAKEFDEFIAGGGKEADARRQRFRQLLAMVGEALRTAVVEACESGQSPEAALAALDRTLEAEEQLDRNANQATLLECWLEDLASPTSTS
jgi:DNA polymerase-3 subunit delta'